MKVYFAEFISTKRYPDMDYHNVIKETDIMTAIQNLKAEIDNHDGLMCKGRAKALITKHLLENLGEIDGRDDKKSTDC